MAVKEKGESLPKVKKGNWKIIVGIVVIVILVGIIAWQFLSFVSKRTSTKYESTLSKYYQSIAKKDTNTIMSIVAKGFDDELSSLKLKPGRYLLFSYNFELLNATNETNPYAKILYSISVTEDSARVSYLSEAYFVLDNDNAKLQYIKKLYKGKNITK